MTQVACDRTRRGMPPPQGGAHRTRAAAAVLGATTITASSLLRALAKTRAAVACYASQMRALRAGFDEAPLATNFEPEFIWSAGAGE